MGFRLETLVVPVSALPVEVVEREEADAVLGDKLDGGQDKLKLGLQEIGDWESLSTVSLLLRLQLAELTGLFKVKQLTSEEG